MTGCDTLLMVGSSFPYSEFLPKEGQARGVQIDIDGRMLSIRYPMDVNLIGDSAPTLRALLPYLARKEKRSWRQTIENDVADWWKTLEARAMMDADPINPQRVFWELSPRLPEDAILAADSGSAANWYARDIRIQRGMMASLSGTLATMGPGVPYAIAAKFCHPSRLVVAMVGDGAMQMNGINGLITIAKYWEEWSNPRLVVLVLNNRDLNQVTWEQRVRQRKRLRALRALRVCPPQEAFASASASTRRRLSTPRAPRARASRSARRRSEAVRAVPVNVTNPSSTCTSICVFAGRRPRPLQNAASPSIRSPIRC
jgi:pyruvate dehydrogenase (quinone)